MTHKQVRYYTQHLKDDLPAGIVVFLVALPLCLGIALASGAPLFSGLIAGFVGGLVVVWLSGSQVSVSGPAAGLAMVVANAIETLGSFQGLLVACIIAGGIQLALGFLRAGVIGAFFPAAVIDGLLAAIGLILITKQLPYAIGYQGDGERDEDYLMAATEAGFFDFLAAFYRVSPGAVIIGAVALLILMIWDTPAIKKQPAFKFIPGPLVAVLWGVSCNTLMAWLHPQWQLDATQLVALPVTQEPTDFFDHFLFPDYQYFGKLATYQVAVTIAIIASLESLLSLEATDKLDPLKRLASTDQELKAQGLGNMVCGFLGGLPITAVIVRSSANINAGGKTRLSCFFHGVLLLLSVLFFSRYLNTIPLASLAAILLHTGYKLAKPALFIGRFRQGMSQFLPCILTVAAILATDLLQGMALGMAIGLFFVIKTNYHAAITLIQDGSHYTLLLNKDVSFLNKALLRRFILMIEGGSRVTIDASMAKFIDRDIVETLHDFIASAADSGIEVETVGLDGKEQIPVHQSLVVVNRRP